MVVLGAAVHIRGDHESHGLGDILVQCHAGQLLLHTNGTSDGIIEGGARGEQGGTMGRGAVRRGTEKWAILGGKARGRKVHVAVNIVKVKIFNMTLQTKCEVPVYISLNIHLKMVVA